MLPGEFFAKYHPRISCKLPKILRKVDTPAQKWYFILAINNPMGIFLCLLRKHNPTCGKNKKEERFILMKKFLSLALAVLMLAVMLPVTALADEPSGSIDSANITHAGGYLKNAVSVELKGVTFAKSVAVKLYSGETLLTTATFRE